MAGYSIRTLRTPLLHQPAVSSWTSGTHTPTSCPSEMAKSSGNTSRGKFHSISLASLTHRIDIGGKLLTNHLKHMISFRQWNLVDETYIVNAVREACSYVSVDYKGDLAACKWACIHSWAGHGLMKGGIQGRIRSCRNTCFPTFRQIRPRVRATYAVDPTRTLLPITHQDRRNRGRQPREKRSKSCGWGMRGSQVLSCSSTRLI